jgi:hypothetical protein
VSGEVPVLLVVILAGAAMVILDPAVPIFPDEFGNLRGIVKARYLIDPAVAELIPVDLFPPSALIRRWMATLSPCPPAEDGTARWGVVEWRPLPIVQVLSWRESYK